MNYTTGSIESIPNCNPVPDVPVHPAKSGLPPLGETLRQTNDALTDANSLADRLIEMLCNMHDEETRTKAPLDCMQRASMGNADLAICLMQKLELITSALGG